MTGRINRGRARKEELRAEANERQEYRDGLTDVQQIARLDIRNYTATKERARLEKRIAKAESK